MSDFRKKAADLGNMMYDAYVSEKDEGMSQLLMQWAKETMWGRICADHIPMFISLWTKLNEKGFVSNEGCVEFGNLDVSVWAEQLEDGTKIIIADNHVTCADDNTTIFRYRESYEHYEFGVVTAFPEEIPSGYNFGDYRDIKFPSLDTLRRYNFDFGCGDFRDKNYVFTMSWYEGDEHTAKDAFATENRIERVLNDLRWFNSEMERF